MLDSLIAKFQLQQSRRVFDRIVRQCQSEVLGYCRRLTAGDIALANDIAQESFIIAYQQLGQLNNTSAFKSWLYRIAYRQYLKVLSEQRKNTLVHQSVSEQQLHTTVADVDETLAQEQLIYRLMSSLSVNQRAVITMHLTLGYSQSEISQLLDMPLGTVKSHCNRGKELMQQQLKDCYKGVA
ncbi:RNA polymerase sigma factor [Thalassotalea ponticola]|uniref:RNA polymerase sigma factor n=1 Tax=Thalassotalea ponticola TaxID=1523392 RepID=UPI0025B35493|nr:RNA polymerase sigma factor [Thalassotalea ponticola]MDN3651914.1 RNA polymerase sigma factor [Thalassotalea ponticola]